MPKASSYKIDTNVTFKDIIFGSDGDNKLKTKNFTIESLLALLEGGDSIKTPSKTTIFLGIDETFAVGLQKTNLTVLPSESPVLIEFIKEEDLQGTDSTDLNKYLFLFPLGAGTYAPLSESVSLSDLTLINTTKPTLDDVQSLDNTVTYDLGNLTSQDFVQIINGTTPSFDLSVSSTNYFFTFFDNGERKLYKFVGSPGVYGSNDLQSSAGDYIEFSSQVFDNDNTTIAKKVIVLPQTSYASETLELEAVANEINTLSSLFSVSDKDLFIVEANELENDVSEAYKSVYLIDTGKGSYGSGGKQILASDIIKVRGERINKNLSSYNNDEGFSTGSTMVPTNVSAFTNDANYATESFVEGLVSFRGSFSSTNDIFAITPASDGDYALVVTGAVRQLWVYSGGNWSLFSAKPYTSVLTSSLSVNNLSQNQTIIWNGGQATLSLPTTLIDGLDFYLRNESSSTITLSSTGSIDGETQILPDRSASISKSANTFYVLLNEEKKGEDIDIGLYKYVDSQAAQSLTADTFLDLSNNGAGVGGYIDALDGVPNIFNVSTGEFDFSGLNIGDVVKIILEGLVITGSSAQVFDGQLVAGDSFGIVDQFFSSRYYKDAGTYAFKDSNEIFISSQEMIDNPAKIRVRIDGAGSSVDAVQFKIKVIKRS